MLAISLQSGSNGNCIYVEGGGAKVLFDAGISGLKAQRALAARGRDISNVDAVVISHDHSDHVCSAGVFNRKFHLPIYVTPATLKAARRGYKIGPIDDVRHFEAGETLEFSSMLVQTIPTPHDGADGAAFVVEADGKRIGILTDLGHVFGGLDRIISTLDGVFLESNYEPEMLDSGPYPERLKARIRGPRGHISNHEAAELLQSSAGEMMKWACLAHLSEMNNRPRTALAIHRRILKGRLSLHVAGRYEPSETFEV